MSHRGRLLQNIGFVDERSYNTVLIQPAGVIVAVHQQAAKSLLTGDYVTQETVRPVDLPHLYRPLAEFGGAWVHWFSPLEELALEAE